MPGLLFDRTARFIVTRDLPATALVSYRAAYTGSESCVIPAGTALVPYGDVPEPMEQVRYEPVHPAQPGELLMVWPAAWEQLGLPDIRQHPDQWRKVTYLTSSLSCYPADHAKLERQLIPEATLTDPKYGSYWFELPLTVIGDTVDILANDDRKRVLERGTRLAVRDAFDCLGLADDDVAVHCTISQGAFLRPRHDVEARHLVAGWEWRFDAGDFTWWWWWHEAPREPSDQWVATERICPSHFLADCDPESSGGVSADREWRALLVPADSINNGVVVT